MAATDDGEGASRERDQRIVDLALQAVYKGTGKGKSAVLEMVRFGMKRSTKVANVAKMDAEGQWKERKQRPREWWQGRNQSMLDVWQGRTHCSVV